KKTRVQRRNTRQAVTGVGVNDRPGAARKLVRRLRAILHQAERRGLARQNRQGRENFEGWLAGNIAYVAMLNPEQGKKLREAYDRVRRA
ncbi:MAG: RNA-directed DNA polymerase, partial [Planctomycetales bacterium]|nr:RNA-directed DNA polymerase [Planctomycetales bacterium]